MKNTAIVLAAFAASVAAAPGLAGEVISNLRIVQPIRQLDQAFEAQGKIGIEFDLAAPADVTVQVDRHLATIGGDAHGNPPGSVGQYCYIAEPPPVRTLKLGTLQPGHHRASWDGLTADGKPVVELQAPDYKEIAKSQTIPETLLLDVPVDRFRFTVRAGGEEPAANFERAVGGISASRFVPAFTGAVRDANGSIVVADRRAWRGRRYSPEWRLEQTLPADPRGHTSDPIHCSDAAVDSRNNVYLLCAPGIYKFTPDGAPAAWDAREDYISNPYPIQVRNVLGKVLDEKTDKDPGKPGFSFGWGGIAIDTQDNVYLAERAPRPRILVFDPSGAFVREVPSPGAQPPTLLRFGTDGTLYVATGRGVAGIDPENGEVRRTIAREASSLHVGPDGVIYCYHSSRVWRLKPDGSPLPFTAKADYVGKDSLQLDLKPPKDAAAPDSGPYAGHIFCVVGEPGGSFRISAGTTSHPYRNTDKRLLHFAADGSFLPDTLSAAIEQHQPGNVFLDNQPARFELFVNNLADSEQEITVDWTLTDFDGKQTRGSAQYAAAPLARQALPLVVDAPEFGHYLLNVKLSAGGNVFASLDTMLARLRSRTITKDPDSPFAVNWAVNCYLMALCGAKADSSASNWWHKIEPVEGFFMKYPGDAIQWSQGMEGFRRYCDRWGISCSEGFCYGEPWLGIPNHRIYSYDRFFGYCLGVMDRFRGQGVGDYKFWNEPNFFWNVPKPFGREHFALVGKHAWCIVKARDKDALAGMDGNAGNNDMMRQLAQFGANDFNDSVQIHYPGAKPLKFDQITVSGEPENKLEMMRELVEIRDRFYPGKPIWNTEEGWWGSKTKSLEIGAVVIPRVYITQMALGADRIWWYQMGRGGEDDPTHLLGPQNLPYATYVSYAAMTRHLEGAEYVGRVDFGKPELFGHLFSRGDRAVLAAWCIQGETEVSVPAGVRAATVADLMDRTHELKAEDGVLPLKLSKRVQYVTFPATEWTRGVAKAELDRRLAALQVASADDLFTEVRKSAKTAHADAAAMTRLFYLVHAGRQAAPAGVRFMPGFNGSAAAEARKAVEAKEAPDGYLRRARVALGWTERLDRSAARLGGETGRGLLEAADLASIAARQIADVEGVIYPGVVINAYLEPRSVREGADPKQPLDEKFRFEIEKKPGESFELELTVWNYYRHLVEGSVRPRLPQGWQATPGPQAFKVEPGKFQRFVFTVNIHADAPDGVREVGGQTDYRGVQVPEIHAQRVRVTR